MHMLAELVPLWACVLLDLGILYYVYKEYAESKELNTKLHKVYRSRKKKDKLVKALINAPTTEVK